MQVKQTHIFYGRNKQLEQLEASLEATSQDGPQFVLVGGVAGIGKTELISHFLNQHAEQNDCVISGKYDENKSAIAYLGLSKALAKYTYSLGKLNEDAQLSTGEQLKQYLGNNLAILQELIPELANVTGSASQMVSVSSHEQHNRFLLAINLYLEFIVSQHRQVYLFLDDLHWADNETFSLLESLLQNKRLSNLYIIGTYRVEETGLGHALANLMRSPAVNKQNLHRVDLVELTIDDVKAIIHEMTDLYNSELDELARHMYEKSRGNPLYLKALINSVLESPEYKQTRLTSGIVLEHLKNTDASQNIIDLLILRLRNLSAESLQVLKLAACMGTIFESRMLSSLYHKSISYIDELLETSINYGLVKQMDTSTESGLYYFAHDRIRESAYELVDDKQALHLKIGRLFFDIFNSGSNESRILDEAVYHLNNGKSLLDDPSEKLSLCECNLKVAIIEKNTGAYSAAVNNLRVARSLLAVDSWSKHHKLTFQIYKNLTEACYLAGKFEEAEELCHLSLERVKDAVERLEIYRIKVMELTHISNWNGAAEEGMACLQEQGINLEDDSEAPAIMEKIESMDIKQLYKLPVCHDQYDQNLQSLMNAMVSPFYVVRPELLHMLTLTMLKRALQNGNTADSAYAWLLHGIILGPAMGNYKRADQLGQLALDLNTALADYTVRSKTKLSYANNVMPWCHPLTEGLELLEEGESDGVNAGDIISAGYCAVSICLQLLASGNNLVHVKEVCDEKITFLQATNNPVGSLALIARQLVFNLQGKIHAGSSLSDNHFDEHELVSQFRANSFYHGLHWYHLCKLQLAVIYNKLEQADEYIAESAAAIHGALGQFSTADHVLCHAIVIGRQYHDHTAEQQQADLTQLAELQQQMAIWAESCVENFQHKSLMIQAVAASLNGAIDESTELYQAAAELAQQNGFIQDVALCFEQLAMLHEGNTAKCREYREAAKDAYRQWGATARVEQLARLSLS